MIGDHGNMSKKECDVSWHVGPDLSIPGISGEFDQGHDYGHPMPSYPQHGMWGSEQQWGGEHPSLYGQDLFTNQMGPVYAVPSDPWQQGDSLGAGDGQWQPYGQYPQMPVPCCMRCGNSPWMGQGFWY